MCKGSCDLSRDGHVIVHRWSQDQPDGRELGRRFPGSQGPGPADAACRSTATMDCRTGLYFCSKLTTPTKNLLLSCGIQVLQHPWITSKDSLSDFKLTIKDHRIKVCFCCMTVQYFIGLLLSSYECYSVYLSILTNVNFSLFQGCGWGYVYSFEQASDSVFGTSYSLYAGVAPKEGEELYILVAMWTT